MPSAVLQVLAYLVCWVGIYAALCKLQSGRGCEWNCRLVALLHGLSSVCATAYVAFVDGPWPFTHPGAENTTLQTSAMSLSLSYFLFDMGWCVYFRTEGPLMLAHHTLSIMGMTLALWSGSSGTEACAVLFGSELTNPLLQTRWFLRRTGGYDGPAGDAVDLLFVLLFTSVRIGMGGHMLYCELTSPTPSPAMKAGGIAIYAVSWFFMVDIARFAWRKTNAKYQCWRRHGHGVVEANGHAGKAY